MVNLLSVTILFGNIVFFALAGLFGFKYTGIEESSVYLIYNITISLIGLIVIIKSFTSLEFRINKRDVILLLFPLSFVFLFLLPVLFLGMPTDAEIRWFLFFLLWSVPSYYIAFINVNSRKLDELAKWIEVMALLFSASTFTSIVIPFFQGIRILGLAGSTSQNASYISALAFGLVSYFILYGEDQKRFKFTQKKIYRIILLILVTTNFISAVISGGRGAFVLIIVYALYYFFKQFQGFDRKKFFRLTVLVLILFIVLTVFESNEILTRGFTRIFQFVGSDYTINWDGSSGRDRVYKNTINIIKEKPILGHGIFSYWRVAPNPHNLILEILLSGGIVYLGLFLISLVFLYKKLRRMTANNAENRIWVIILFYPMVMLMFSGSYLVSSQLWFVFSVILFYKATGDKMKNNSYRKK